MTCPHEYYERVNASADGYCPICLAAKLSKANDLLRIIARSLEIGHMKSPRKIQRIEMINLARKHCDANGLSYARTDLRVEERVRFLKVGDGT